MTEEEMPLEIAMWRKKKSYLEEINLSQCLREENGLETEKAQTVKTWKGQTKPETPKQLRCRACIHRIHEGEFIFKPCFDLELKDGALPQLSG